MENLIELKNVSKVYGYKKALNSSDLTISSGKIVGLLGPNGSGKTTLIKLLSGILTKSSGEIKIGGYDIGIETKKIVSYLPEHTYLNNSMSVMSILKLFKDFYSDFNTDRALEMLKNLNINPKDKLKTMSKGTKEKVQLILVMSREASVYLLDEPIAGVDPIARDYIIKTIITNYNENATVIISTHLISDIEKILDEVILINQGDIITHKTTDQIKLESNSSIDEYFRKTCSEYHPKIEENSNSFYRQKKGI